MGAQLSGEYLSVACWFCLVSGTTNKSTRSSVKSRVKMEGATPTTEKSIVALWYAQIAQRWAAWDESRRQAEESRAKQK
jgi:hypothetical protein